MSSLLTTLGTTSISRYAPNSPYVPMIQWTGYATTAASRADVICFYDYHGTLYLYYQVVTDSGSNADSTFYARLGAALGL